MLKMIQSPPLPFRLVNAYSTKFEEHDAIIEKNKKLKASKKPEEPVPVLD
jgi:hypothetical protein